MKKILFLSNNIPNNYDAGGILYSNIIKQYGEECFFFISLVETKNNLDCNIPYKRIINHYSIDIPSINIFFKILKKLSFIRTIYIFINLLRFREEITHSIINEKFDFIFAPLRGAVLLLLPYILKKTNLPLYAMVEDTVEAEFKDPYFVYTQKKKNYYELLSSVKSLGVAGQTMRDYFKTNYNIDSTILIPSFEKFTNSFPKLIDKEFNVFFAGNTYARKELITFIKALEKLNLSSNIVVNFYVAAHIPFFSKSNKLTIINVGWVTQKKLNEYMNKCHVSYLPYRMEPEFQHQMKYAFPGKSGLYVSNNLPIFFTDQHTHLLILF